jgi:hypothetical protein
MVGAISADAAKASLLWMTSQAHLAGTAGGAYVAGRYLGELSAIARMGNMTSTRVEYDNHTVLLSYPVSAALTIDGASDSWH